MIERLRAVHGPLAFFQSSGGCDEVAPICFAAGERPPSAPDVKLGEIGGAAFYIDEELDARWGRPPLVIGVADGPAESFSLEALEGVHFTTRTASRTGVDAGELSRRPALPAALTRSAPSACSAIASTSCGHRRGGRPCPIPGTIISLAPGIAFAVALPPEGVMSGSLSPWITSVGAVMRVEAARAVAGGEDRGELAAGAAHVGVAVVRVGDERAALRRVEHVAGRADRGEHARAGARRTPRARAGPA